ncbi:MAG: hypothetical protein ACXVX5_02745 [Mycobacterium sp.]
MSKLVSLVGLGMAGVGLAHFVKPEVFQDITATAFPDNTEQHLYIDGAAETVLGLALAVPRTRKLGVIGLIGYGGYLAANVLKNRAA